MFKIPKKLSSVDKEDTSYSQLNLEPNAPDITSKQDMRKPYYRDMNDRFGGRKTLELENVKNVEGAVVEQENLGQVTNQTNENMVADPSKDNMVADQTVVTGGLNDEKTAPGESDQSTKEGRVVSWKDKLPKELRAMFLPMACDLCSCVLSSNLVSKYHYNGKKHEKKVKAWLVAHPKYRSLLDEIAASSPTESFCNGNDINYCDKCDVSLGSESTAQAHYVGKKHQQVINSGVMKNSFYNKKTGQYERMENATTDSSGRFGIGVAFTKQSVEEKAIVGHYFRCDLCSITCTSQAALKAHLEGYKHMRSLFKHPAYRQGSRNDSDSTDDNILNTVVNETRQISAKDLSVYRTPSGFYYCDRCDVTLNSYTQFAQHSSSKKHKLNCA